MNERTDYMAGIAAEALAPMVVEDTDRFDRRIEREPLGVVFVVAPWNYPYLTAINTIVPGADRRQRGDAEARQPDPAGRRAAGRGASMQAGVPEDVFQNVVLDHATTEALIAAARLRLRQLHRLGRRRAGDGTRGGGHLHRRSGWSLAARTRAM